ncbi:hypothetical protein PMF13cell1_02908 [Blautia producta]|uniref:Mannosylglycerate hydrolase MGH1-like glycoside hydrolase domain-containing protein n=1 Tax=Blautia producta TaxID=33035 RepID=A0A4P6LZF8_9FIRM|nr:glycogen debranching protein [Blautia producta]QBE97352.1 hypothetical protein PMF13cell1_02908 [Blautia producta]
MLKLNLNEVPFSCAGSYLVFNLLTDVNQWNMEPGLYLRSVHGTSGSYCPNADNIIARLELLIDGEVTKCEVEADPSVLSMKHADGCISIAFKDDSTVLIQGTGPDVGIRITWMTKDYDFIQPVMSGEETWYLMNHYTSIERLMLYNVSGKLEIKQKWDKVSAEYCQLSVTEEQGSFLLVLEEVRETWRNRHMKYDFKKSCSAQEESFLNFYHSMPKVPEPYEKAREIVSYVNWCSIVRKDGHLKKDAMLMSKNWMCSIWSWDHCFNALSLSYNNPDEAWDQFMLLFDFQDSEGRLPDCVNDVAILHNFTKPPIHGWILSKLRKNMSLSERQIAEAYDRLEKWTKWWLNHRDQDGDGLCEYTHGNDSGWDNATVFGMLPPVTTPDLAAFLILQMEELQELANIIGKTQDAMYWKTLSEDMMEKMLNQLFPNGRPIALQTISRQEIKNDSLFSYLPIILAKRLPEAIRNYMIGQLESPRFCTEYGLATESPASKDYINDGYWRGPIWAPSTMVIADGLWECGEKEFVRNLTRKFCSMIMKSGSAENFDARTGEGLRDRAYTWTGSVMLVMAQEFLMD